GSRKPNRAAPAGSRAAPAYTTTRAATLPRGKVQQPGAVVPQHGPQPVVAQTQPGQGLQLVGIRIGDVGEIGAQDDPIAQPRQPLDVPLWHRGELVGEVG